MFSLCAIVSTVQSSNWVLIVIWIRSSVSRSMAAVASSRIRILVLRSSALARQMSCLWPTLRTEMGLSRRRPRCPGLCPARNRLCYSRLLIRQRHAAKQTVSSELPGPPALQLTHTCCSITQLVVACVFTCCLTQC